MFTKLARIEVSDILGIKGSPKGRTASLDKFADFDDYRTQDGFLYARIRAISSRVNKNHDGWPSVELAGSKDIFDRHLSSEGGFTIEASKDAEYGFSTFLGKPVFVDHNNSDPERARGVIVDAKLHVEDHRTAADLDSYYASAPSEHLPPTWVELLLEIDAKSFPKFAKEIIEGSKDPSKGIDGFSMGCDVERSVCSICKHSAVSPDEFCNHIKLKGAHFDYVDPETGHKTSRKAYEDCYGVRFFEISGVFDPADHTALSMEVRASVADSEPCPDCGDSENISPSYDTGKMYCGRCGNSWTPAHVLQDHYALPEVQHPLGPHTGADNIAKKCPECGSHTTGLINDEGDCVCHACGNSFKTDVMHDQIDSKESGFGGLDMEPDQMSNDHLVPCPCEGNDPSCQLCRHTPGFYVPTGNEGHDGSEGIADLGGPRDMAGWAGDRWIGEVNPRPDDPGWGGRRQGSTRVAENPLPQGELIRAPEDIDTLRKEMVCPICGSTMDDETCEVCGYVEPPDGFGNPDLQKAQETVPGQEDQGPNGADAGQQGQVPGMGSPENSGLTAHVNNDMASWTLNVHPKVAARVGDEEATDEPQETVVSDQTAPVTSQVRTANDFVKAAGRNKETQMEKTAEAASGAPAVAKPEVNTEVEGVGGVLDGSNEEASKADAQIDVEGEGGTGVEGVAADSTEGVEQGNEHSKNIEAIPTKTFDDGSSAVERQSDPVGGEVFPSSDEGVKASGHTASDPANFPEDDGGLAGGNANQGTQPADPVGKAEDRVDVLDTVTSPANNSGPTKTWTGTDGNAVTRQQDPTTDETLEGEDIVNLSPKGSSHIFAAFKLADLEVELGMLNPDRKYARVAELEAKTPGQIQEQLAYAQKVKTAGLSKGVAKTAKKLPVLGRSSNVDEVVKTEDTPENDHLLFS